MLRLVASLFLLLCVVQCGAVRIIEFCPDPYLYNDADEYLVIYGTGSLDGITVSDGEGGFRFPPGTIINGKLTIARDAIAFCKTHNRMPDYEWYDYSPVVPDVISGDKLRMANSRDELMVYDHGTLIQTVSWPKDIKPREGQVHYLEDGVWDKRPLMLGQSRFSTKTYKNITVTTFVSPDNSNKVFLQAVASANRTVHVNVYEFSSQVMAHALNGAHERGADVIILVEGGPVGGISPEEKTALWMMNQSGIPVYQMTSAGGEKAPYRFDHAKYVVIDNRAVLLTSENFKASGFPPEGIRGNRGWGVYLEDTETAQYFEDVFLSDIQAPGSIPIAGTPGASESPSTVPYTPEFSPRRFTGATVTPVLAPDTSYLILDLLNSAQETIDIEQAYITNESAFTLNPYLATAINASRRGVHVRILLDAYWYNVEDEKDNDEMAALINHIGIIEKIPLEARCADLESNNLEKVHNKGVIVDNQSVLVSSINWNSNSPNFNREAGVIIEHPGAAQYFKEIFEDDWQPVRYAPVRNFDYLKIAGLIAVFAGLIALFLWRRQRI
ncbi:MAG: phospholipase D-like domain-containing protein [Methanoregula sp.]|nr:MAG: phospholipase D-like domain-containing protein [Methanoregula sp.]